VKLTDAQIAAVVSTANSGEIEMGMFALTRALDSGVRDFAQMMVTMHTAAQARSTAVLLQVGVTPEPNATSAQLMSDAQAMTARLRDASADQFDLVYIAGQVDVHTKVLMLIDDQLLPSATAEPLRADLMVTRGEVQMHLQAAMTLMSRVEGNTEDAGVSP